tara:strand:+ start:288 stop:500 length:213 start_codon:yes stop_codon:yes gene_type:complete
MSKEYTVEISTTVYMEVLVEANSEGEAHDLAEEVEPQDYGNSLGFDFDHGSVTSCWTDLGFKVHGVREGK